MTDYLINIFLILPNIYYITIYWCNSHQSKKETIIHPKVLNLSSEYLRNIQARFLSKGLKFTSIPRRNTIEIEKDVNT